MFSIGGVGSSYSSKGVYEYPRATDMREEETGRGRERKKDRRWDVTSELKLTTAPSNTQLIANSGSSNFSEARLAWSWPNPILKRDW